MKDSSKHEDSERHSGATIESEVAQKKPAFEKPKLTFVPPKLVKHGEVTELTGFFGAFSP